MLLSVVVKSIKRKSHRGDQSVTTDQITTDVVASVNEAIRDLEKLLPKRYWHKKGTVAVTTGVAGTAANYSLASDVQEPIVFWYNSSGYKELHKIVSDREWIRDVWDPNQSTNFPQFYREIGPDSSGYKQIEIFPISDRSLTLNYEYYKTKGTDLTTSDLSSEIPDLPDHVQDAVEKGGLYYFQKGFDDALQQIALRDYEVAKQALEESDEKDQDADLSLRWGVVRTDVPGFRLS